MRRIIVEMAVSYILDVAESERDFDTKFDIIYEYIVNNLGVEVEE